MRGCLKSVTGFVGVSRQRQDVHAEHGQALPAAADHVDISTERRVFDAGRLAFWALAERALARCPLGPHEMDMHDGSAMARPVRVLRSLAHVSDFGDR